jgi:hypothetical protein
MSSARAAVRESDAGVEADRRSVVAASLAALAESGVIFLPLRQLLMEDARVHGGPLATYPLFVALFVGGTAWATLRRRRSHTLPIVAVCAVILTVLQVLIWGSADAAGGLFSGVLVLMVTMRLLTLAHRDWQDPIGQSFAIGSALVLMEVASASTFAASWRSLLVVVVPQFFLGSLWSRAASVRLTTLPATVAPHEDAGGAVRLRGAAAGMAILGAMMGVAALVGGKGGVLEWVGGMLYLMVSRVLVAVAFVAAHVVLPPLYWLLGRLHISLPQPGPRLVPDTVKKAPQTGWVGVMGFIVLAAMFLLLLQLIRRRWHRMLATGLRAPDGPEPPAVPISGRRWVGRRSSRVPRRELPADTVRRWYAEALMVLEGKGLVKAPSRTPAEFAPEVARAFPESTHSFEALTRAYEQVRYGRLTMERGALEDLADRHSWAMDVFRRSERKDQADDQGEA